MAQLTGGKLTGGKLTSGKLGGKLPVNRWEINQVGNYLRN